MLVYQQMMKNDLLFLTCFTKIVKYVYDCDLFIFSLKKDNYTGQVVYCIFYNSYHPQRQFLLTSGAWWVFILDLASRYYRL